MCTYGATPPSSPTKSSLIVWDSSPSTLTLLSWSSKIVSTLRLLCTTFSSSFLSRSTKRSSDRQKYTRVPAQSHLRAQKKRAKGRDGLSSALRQLGGPLFTARVGPPGRTGDSHGRQPTLPDKPKYRPCEAPPWTRDRHGAACYQRLR